MKKHQFLTAASMATLFAAGTTAADDFLQAGNAGLDLRYRLELVDEDGFTKSAAASTLLTKLWYRSGEISGFSGYLEGTRTTVLGKETYNNTINGNITRPVVADPEVTELNQAYVQFKNDSVTLRGGRQAIVLGNQRFIGAVGWRQNDQTYDAATLKVTPLQGLSASYGYVWNVNRIFGDDHPLGNLGSSTHLLNLGYDGFGLGTLSAYAYFLDFDDNAVAGLSSQTSGARFDGSHAIDDTMKVSYSLEVARQSDHGNNPAEYQASYLHGSLGVSMGGYSGEIGYERLGSDGGTSFKTPLATLHKFNGWADKFLATPVNGLADLYASVAYKVPEGSVLGGTLFKAVYHRFDSTEGGLDYGSEVDLLVSRKITKYLTTSVKAAFYNADGFATDTSRVWFTLEAKF